MEQQNSIIEEIERKRPVDVAKIERELAELWKAAASSKEGGGEAVTRVCLLNLLIYTSDEDHASTLGATIATVTEHAPCRAMVLVGNPKNPESHTEAWISSHCHMTQNRQQVCCEEIRVTASGKALEHLSDTIAPLLVADLPTFLWWQDAHALSQPLFQGFLKQVNRIIVDSAQLTHRDPEFRHQAEIILNARHQAAFSDLNWARLTVWEELIASFFDAPEMHVYLKRMNKVTITYSYNGEIAGVPIRTLFLVSWLSNRMSWKLKDAAEVSPQHLEFRFRSPYTRLQVEILPETNTNFPSTVITSVTLSTAGEKPATFEVRRRAPKEKEDVFATRVVITDGASVDRVVSSHRPHDADLIAHEVEIFGRDRAYEEAVKSTLSLIEEIQAELLV